jgi:hypothetical protein
LDAIDFNNINETALFFQAGYLTIEKEFSEMNKYIKKITGYHMRVAELAYLL